jgi:protein-S-isoprenylcysteine O-methyltransferase Ste14
VAAGVSDHAWKIDGVVARLSWRAVPSDAVRLLVNGAAIVAVAYALALACFIFLRPGAVTWWAVLLALALIALPLALIGWAHRRRRLDSN